MHTTGEPTRIVYAGYPPLSGTLLEQRALARSKYDHVRRKLLLEPRGHRDMYGAVLRPATELVDSGEADIGVLFMTNVGYSNMCGHATIALGRFLIDTHDTSIFPNRWRLRSDDGSTVIKLHVPSGIVVVAVKTRPDHRADASAPVSFTSVPCFATGIGVQIAIPADRRWRVGQSVRTVTVDFACGGGYFAIVRADELYDAGKSDLSGGDLKDLDEATSTLKDLVNENPSLRKYVTPPNTNPSGAELGLLRALVVSLPGLGVIGSGTTSAETGICYFDDHQIDRSPTGSAAGARMALAYAQGAIHLNEGRTYHSLLSNSKGGKGSFKARVLEETAGGVIVKIEGFAFYTGYHTFISEEEDILGDDGFILEQLHS
ncbi:uncharacterized protein B0I36DRAFT_377394 [Microdochium trichocladiopsis]|uniref:trans-L-3-hydroxyproline dehydratase n=1 Tax=Microdochium trichocladiopsis TaxID=1682393 RepID=A0A9P8XU53_9PEZI|nr:uncharacterized protein B0I36DRAFT_377394 [Microdochium trichocladiopsis]KAH7017966.1 hypothetical protein B0I36DRAFT_377394 [Microdochium trichocladiopsis]